MVLKGSKIKILLICLMLAAVLSCDDIPWLTFCPDCYSTEPEMAVLELKLDYSDGPFTTKVRIYEGNVEDSVLYKSFEISTNHRQMEVPLNKLYAITATYYQNGTYYIAHNSAMPRVRYDKETCEEPCYYVYDRVVNLRLR